MTQPYFTLIVISEGWPFWTTSVIIRNQVTYPAQARKLLEYWLELFRFIIAQDWLQLETNFPQANQAPKMIIYNQKKVYEIESVWKSTEYGCEGVLSLPQTFMCSVRDPRIIFKGVKGNKFRRSSICRIADISLLALLEQFLQYHHFIFQSNYSGLFLVTKILLWVTDWRLQWLWCQGFGGDGFKLVRNTAFQLVGDSNICHQHRCSPESKFWNKIFIKT